MDNLTDVIKLLRPIVNKCNKSECKECNYSYNCNKLSMSPSAILRIAEELKEMKSRDFERNLWEVSN